MYFVCYILFETYGSKKKKEIIFLLYSWVLFSERVEILPQQKQRIDGFLKKNNHVQLKDLLECWNVRWDKGGVTQIKTERLIFQVTKKKKKVEGDVRGD